MNIKGRLNRVEREAWKRNLSGQVRRVHYVAVYGQEPGKPGPPKIAFELDIDEPVRPGAGVINYETHYETKETNKN